MSKVDIVKLIQKMAQQLEDPPGASPNKNAPLTPRPMQYGDNFAGPVQDSPTGTPVTDIDALPGSKKQAPGMSSGKVTSPIIDMQKALISLANAVTAQLNPEPLSDRSSQQGQRAEGRDSFADFIAKTYMRNGRVPAQEFSPDPDKKNIHDKEPREVSKMSWVMDTMKRIGGEKNELKVDGVWGPRTNAALRNVCAFAHGLFELASAFHAEQNAYSQKNLEYLNESIPQKDTDINITEKISRADDITKHINGIQQMYEQLKESILQNPQYKDYIEGTKPYVTHDSFNITQQQLDSIKKSFPNGWQISTGERDPVNITVADISSIEAINEWISNHDSELKPYTVLQSIKDQIGGGR